MTLSAWQLCCSFLPVGFVAGVVAVVIIVVVVVVVAAVVVVVVIPVTLTL